MDDDKLTRLQELADKQEIFELSATYMRGLDRLDGDLVKSVYHGDATDHRGFFTGTGWEVAEFAMGLLKDHLVNHHMLGQANITLEGDVAFGEIYFHAYHRVILNEVERDFVIGGRYVDRYERRDNVWKIAHRTELNDFARMDPIADDWLRETPEALRGYRGADDLSSQLDKVRHL
ncbi:MAG: nuclear transport factor 2 family protein [Pseudomonadota bacterium]